MHIAILTLAHLLGTCAPNVGRRTMAAIVRVETGGNALKIHDNTLGRTFEPHDANQGVVWANQLMTLHHSIDLGISQINDANLRKLGLSVRESFDACSNVRAGATILSSDYRAAAAQFGPGQYALRRAIGAYNTGSLYAGYGYIAKILSAAGIAADDEFRVPELQSADAARPIAGLHAVPVATPRRAVVSQAPTADPFGAPILIGTTTIRVRQESDGGRQAHVRVAASAPTVSPERSVILAVPSTSVNSVVPASSPSAVASPVSTPTPTSARPEAYKLPH